MRRHGGHLGVQLNGVGALRALSCEEGLVAPLVTAGAAEVVLRAMRLHPEAGGWGHVTAGAAEAVLRAVRLHPEAGGACGALKGLSIDAGTRQDLARGGVVGLVLRGMQGLSVEAATRQDLARGGVVGLVLHGQAHGGIAGVQREGCGVVSALGVDDATRLKLGKEGGIEGVLRAMRAYPGDAGVQEVRKGGVEAVLRAMWGHPGNGGVQAQGCRALMALAVDGAARIQIEASNGSVTVLDAIKCAPGEVEGVA
ncbi:hypothetical protein T484DRAFT_1801918, partial [Baffinella frigidus]